MMQAIMENMPMGSSPENMGAAPESTLESAPMEQTASSPEVGENLTFENPIEDPVIFETEENIVEAATKKSESEENASEEIPEDVRWRRAYEEESVKQWNEFEKQNLEKAKNYREEQERWYEKAKAKAEEVMNELDPQYTVGVQDSIISPDDNDKAEYRAITLGFKSPKGPGFSWSMNIEPSEEYIEHKLPEVIKKTYERKSQGIFERNTGKRNVEGIQNIKFDFFPTKDEKYLAGEIDRFAALDAIKEDLSVESSGDSEFIKKMLSHLIKIKQKRFIMNRGSMRQRTIEITTNEGNVIIREKDIRGSHRTWNIDRGGKTLDGSLSEGELKNLLKEFGAGIKTRTTGSSVNSRPA